MGLLSLLASPFGMYGEGAQRRIPGVTPFVQPQQSEPGPMGPPLAMPQPKPQQPRGFMSGLQGFGQRLQTATESPLFQIGMSLLGNAPGSNWQGVGQDVRSMNEGYRERQLQDNELRRQKTTDAREETAFGRQQQDWSRQDQQYAAWERRLATATPEEQAHLRAIGPAGYAEFTASRDERDWRSHEAQLDRNAQMQAARVAAEQRRDPRDSIQYRNDVARLGGMGEAANLANVATLPRLRRAREIVSRLSQIGGMDNPLSANRRIQLSQLGQFGSEARGLLQELQRIQTQFTVDEARALAPVSNTDFGRLMEINPNGNMTVDAAYSIISQMEQELTRGVNNYTAAAQWADRYNGLTGTLDEQGRTFEGAYSQSNASPPPAPAPVATPPRRTTSTLPSPNGLAEGTRARDSVTQREFVIRNGQWILSSVNTDSNGVNRDSNGNVMLR